MLLGAVPWREAEPEPCPDGGDAGWTDEEEGTAAVAEERPLLRGLESGHDRPTQQQVPCSLTAGSLWSLFIVAAGLGALCCVLASQADGAARPKANGGQLLGLAAAPAEPPLLAAVAAALAMTTATTTTTTTTSGAFRNATEEFQALDTDHDGLVIVHSPGAEESAGVPMTLESFKLAVDREKAQDVAALSPEDTAAAAGLGSQRAQALAFASDLPSPEPENFTEQPVRLPNPGKGFVSELYTFGAPATAVKGVRDALRPGGCFVGLRVVAQNEHYMVSAGAPAIESDPVAALLNFAYEHALMDSMQAGLYNERDHGIKPCAFYKGQLVRLSGAPRWDNFWWVNGHMIYPSLVMAHAAEVSSHRSDPGLPAPDDLPPIRRRLKEDQTLTVEEEIIQAKTMAHFAFMTYNEPQQIAVDASDWGWTFVARANAISDSGAGGNMFALEEGEEGESGEGGHGGDNVNTANVVETVKTFSNGINDHALLYQNRDTLQCVLAFEGSGLDDAKDWLSNMNIFPVQFCNLGDVHRGFRAKVLRMVAGIDYRQTIARHLPSCSAVIVAGHSLGGAQAELFAACNNQALKANEPGYLDYRLLSFGRGEPAALPSFHSDHADGSFFRNRGNNLCIDVQGTMGTVYQTPVIMYYCELPDSNFSQDQRWEFRTDGRIVNKLSGKCMDGKNATNGTGPVEQWDCGGRRYQKWTLTEEGFLQSRRSGKCVNSKMEFYDCPYTDQKWHFSTEGFVVNEITGKCLDVKGNPGIEDGSELILWPCEYSPDTDQRWELVTGGFLRNRLSGRCASAQMKKAAEDDPALVLGPCDDAIPFEVSQGGFWRSTTTGKCLNVQGQPGTEDGSAITLQSCEDKLIATDGLWRRMADGFIRNVGDSGSSQQKCIEVKGGDSQNGKEADGAPLWLDYCDRNTDQKWELTPEGLMRNVIGGQKCLAIKKVPGPPPLGPDRTLWIENCVQTADPALYLELKWHLLENGQLQSRMNKKCLREKRGVEEFKNDPAAATAAARLGSDVALWDCNGDLASGAWELTSNASLVSEYSGQCLEVQGGGALPSPPLVLQRCTGSEEQRWEQTSEGFLRNPRFSLCVGLAIEVTSPSGFVVVPVLCPTGADQEWEVLPTGQMRNKGSGLCLDGGMANNGEPFWELVARGCDTSRAEQIWEQIPAPRVAVH